MNKPKMRYGKSRKFEDREVMDVTVNGPTLDDMEPEQRDEYISGLERDGFHMAAQEMRGRYNRIYR